MPLFVADVHLGKLARWLRMLGFDMVYSPAFTHNELLNIAEAEHRVLLSRNAAIGRHHPSVATFAITGDDPAAQLKQVLQYFQLLSYIQPFTKCMVCNGMLEVVSKESIMNELPEKTAMYYHQFWQCVQCKRIYWKGPHYNRMMRFIQNITAGNN